MSARSLPPADVVLIGLGGAGGVAAHVLTAAGVEVVGLEAGPRVAPSDMTLDEIRNDRLAWLAQPKAAHEVPTWRTSEHVPAGPSPWPLAMVNAVGGSTLHYPGVSPRFLPWHFRSRSATLERYGAGAIPAASTLADWPLDYDELEPYYDLVEHAIGISGQAGNVAGRREPAGNAFEAPRARDYPMGPLRRSGWTELMAGAARGLGWHPFPAPAAINSEPYNGNPACTYCGFCAQNGCYADAKGSVSSTVLRQAEATGLLRVETGARVVRIETGPDGRASGVTYVQDGEECFQPARVVLLATFTFENARLLLLSRSRAFPAGLANGHGQVGMHYMAHIATFGSGVFHGRRLNVFSGPWSQATCVDDWNADNFDHGGLGFVGGSLFTAYHEFKPIASAGVGWGSETGRSVPPWAGRWGAGWKAWLAQNAQSVGSAVAEIENLSYEHNRIDLDPVARDPYGLPVARITHRTGEPERRAFRFMSERLEEWLREAGADETWTAAEILVDGWHSYGGTRMGDDPDGAVVDRWGFAHEVPNLGVLGASTFPTTGGHNPTLTVQALAWRSAQRLLDDWSALAGT